MGIMFTV